MANPRSRKRRRQSHENYSARLNILKNIEALDALSPTELVKARREKFLRIGRSLLA